MNILVLSCGTRNKIIQYFKRELNGAGKVIATDMSPNAPALYEADVHYIVPRMGRRSRILQEVLLTNMHCGLSVPIIRISVDMSLRLWHGMTKEILSLSNTL